MKKSTPPKAQEPNRPNLDETYGKEEIAEMLNALHDNKDLPLECAVMIALSVGARSVETDYLKWSELDLELENITVKGSRTCADVEIIKAKTKSGKPRETSLCTILINRLKKYKEWQLQNKKVLGKDYFNSDNVLVRSDGNNNMQIR